MYLQRTFWPFDFSTEDSTRLMQSVSSEYKTYSSVLGASRQLVTKLQRRDWTDRLLLLFGLVVFCLTVLSILRRRLWIWVPGWKWVTGQCSEDDWLCFWRFVRRRFSRSIFGVFQGNLPAFALHDWTIFGIVLLATNVIALTSTRNLIDTPGVNHRFYTPSKADLYR